MLERSDDPAAIPRTARGVLIRDSLSRLMAATGLTLGGGWALGRPGGDDSGRLRRRPYADKLAAFHPLQDIRSIPGDAAREVSAIAGARALRGRRLMATSRPDLRAGFTQGFSAAG